MTASVPPGGAEMTGENEKKREKASADRQKNSRRTPRSVAFRAEQGQK